MPRFARRLSETRIYHVIFRGVSRYNIFEEEKDYQKILEIITDLKEEMDFDILAYCLMSNHAHLIIRELELGEISLIMKRMLVRYAGWFNKKYDRSGILTSNRFSSEPVETDDYLITLLRYIHQNPVKGGLASTIESYEWSSFKEYCGKGQLCNTDIVLSIIDRDSFINFNYEIEEDEYEISMKAIKIDDEFVRLRIKEILGGKDPFELGEMPINERNKIIKQLKNVERFSIRQIERVTGISRGVISRCK
ncbi:MAG TPA: transposase [Sedimentibacter sp.]|jgi:REP element-mobilizing transposase RayT|nr:transposase [Sedimentibacter sp.]HPW99849.1 transposase [Sedimentibacter sp.]